MLRVHTAGSVGGSTGIVAASLVQSGVHDRVLTVAFEKQSESNATWALSIALPVRGGHRGRRRRLLRAARSAATSGAPGRPRTPGIRVALKDRQNALKNPLRPPPAAGHQLREGRELADALGSDPLPRDLPVVRRRVRDGDGAASRLAERSPRKVAWIHATEMRSEPTMFSGRDQVMPRATLDNAKSLYKKARHHEPARGDRLRRDLRAVLVVRADVDGGHADHASATRAGR